MQLRGARFAGVRGRAGCEGCRVSHSPAQMLQSEGEGVWGLARPGGTRHQDTRQGGCCPAVGREGVVLCPAHTASSCPVWCTSGMGQRKNVVWDFSVWACVVTGVLPQLPALSCSPPLLRPFLLPLWLGLEEKAL